MRTSFICGLLPVLLLLAAAPWSFATTIIKPVAAPVFESEYLPDTRLADDSRNGAGLSADLLTGDPAPGVYPTHSTAVTDMWLTATPQADNATFIVYDLGAEYVVSGLHQWNYNEPGGFLARGLKDVALTFSTTSAVAGFGGTLNTVFAISTGAGNQGETITFPDLVVARWVRLDASSDYGGDHMGLSEIRFLAPDPGTLAETPADGSTIVVPTIAPFDTITLTDAIMLENVGGPDTAIAVTGYSIAGPDAAQFDLSDFAPTILGDGESVEFDLEFTSLAAEGGYSATLTIVTDVGNVTYELLVSPVPEPSALALLALGGLGLARRPRHPHHSNAKG